MTPLGWLFGKLGVGEPIVIREESPRGNVDPEREISSRLRVFCADTGKELSRVIPYTYAWWIYWSPLRRLGLPWPCETYAEDEEGNKYLEWDPPWPGNGASLRLARVTRVFRIVRWEKVG